MNSGNPYGWRPTSTPPLQQREAFAFSNRPNDAAASTGISQNVSNATDNSMPFPNMTVPFATGEIMYGNCQPYTNSVHDTYDSFMVDLNDPHSQKSYTADIHGTHQPCTKSIRDNYDSLMVDLNDLHGQQSSLIDPNPSNINSDIPCMYEQNRLCAGQNVKGLLDDRTANTDGALVNDIAQYDSFWDLGTNDNFVLSKGANTGTQKTSLNEVGFGHIHGSEINNFIDLEASTDMPYNTQHSGGISFGNQVEVCPAEFDGSFLSLGIGDCVIPNLPPDLNFPNDFQVTNSSLRRDQNMVNQFAGQTHITGQTSANNTGWSTYDSTSGVNPNQFHIAQKSNATDMQYRFPTSNTGNLSIEGDRHARYPNLQPQKGFVTGDTTASSGQYNSSSAKLLNPGRSEPSGSTSEAVRLSCPTSHPTSQLLSKRSEGNVQRIVSPQSSTLRSFSKLIRSSTRQDTPGQLLPANDGLSPGVSGSGFYPGNVGVVGGNSSAHAGLSSLLPQRQRVQFDKHGAPQATGNSLLLGNTGTQVTDIRAAYAARLRSQLNNLRAQRPSHSQSVSADLRESSFRPGGSQGLPIQLSRDPRFPSPTTGHSQGQIFQSSRNLGAPSYTTGQVIPLARGYGITSVAQVPGESSLKRSAVRPSATVPRVQRRKIQSPMLQSAFSTQQNATGVSAPVPIHMARVPPSIRSAQQIAPRVSAPVPPSIAHIRWEGAEESPERRTMTGEKCMICKRDLSLTAEGPVYQPAVAPAVAILPCRHTFHDVCLQKITPPDQSKNPPCIPCAIGDII